MADRSSHRANLLSLAVGQLDTRRLKTRGRGRQRQRPRRPSRPEESRPGAVWAATSDEGGRDGARRDPSRHVHHRRRAAQRRLLHARARPAAREEDRQPGRSDRLPPLLRGRAGQRGQRHHVLRVPRRATGRAGAGMVHTVVWRVGSPGRAGVLGRPADGRDVRERRDGALRFEDPEGLAHELVIPQADDQPLVADHPEIPADSRSRASTPCARSRVDPERQPAAARAGARLPARRGLGWEARGEERGGGYVLEPPPLDRGIGGAGTVHHVAWASTMDGPRGMAAARRAAGARPTAVIDRFWFRSIYFREPSGVLFEIATLGPGFATDEDPAHLGERARRCRRRSSTCAIAWSRSLTPLPDPRPARAP